VFSNLGSGPKNYNGKSEGDAIMMTINRVAMYTRVLTTQIMNGNENLLKLGQNEVVQKSPKWYSLGGLPVV
jgi:hypothetical protein